MLFKKNISPQLEDNIFFPAGSVSSFFDSVVTDDDFFKKSAKEDSMSEDDGLISCRLISYESVLGRYCAEKACQTDVIEQVPVEKSRVQELNKTIAKLSMECNSYAKQNENLRKEISVSNKEPENDTILLLKDEAKRLKAKLHVHETMVEKLIVISEEICGDPDEFHKSLSKIDYHAYNYLISKLEIAKSRMRRYLNKIHQLESDKISMTELLNFYISAGKLIETQKVRENSCSSTTPECVNHVFSSRVGSVLIENCSRTIPPTPFEPENFEKKKPGHKKNNVSENKALGPNTLTSLKGISRLSRPSSKKIKLKKGHENSFSVSPLIPKPKKNTKKRMTSKENTRSSTIRAAKSIHDKGKKPANRCKS